MTSLVKLFEKKSLNTGRAGLPSRGPCGVSAFHPWEVVRLGCVPLQWSPFWIPVRRKICVYCRALCIFLFIPVLFDQFGKLRGGDQKIDRSKNRSKWVEQSMPLYGH